MSRTAYVNGPYVPMGEAVVHIDDRGYQFSDGVYEVVSIRNGNLIDEDPHLDRLRRSLEELEAHPPMSRAALKVICRELMHRNRVKDALLYIQVTRGVAKRDHAFPAFVEPSLVITCRRFNFDAIKERSKVGIKVSSQPDIRWGRCDIKTTSLLPNILAKQAAREAGGFEALLVDENGYVTEGSSTNIWMVDNKGTLITRSTNDNILSGITRAALKDIAEKQQIKIEERAFTLEEVKAASEMFLTSATSGAMPIIAVDDAQIASGKPGPTASKLAEAYWAFMDQ